MKQVKEKIIIKVYKEHFLMPFDTSEMTDKHYKYLIKSLPFVTIGFKFDDYGTWTMLPANQIDNLIAKLRKIKTKL